MHSCFKTLSPTAIPTWPWPLALALLSAAPSYSGDAIVHDAEYYILEDQHQGAWATEDAELDAELARLEGIHGQRPNIIHIMWDDSAVGEVGSPQSQKVRGFETPNINPLATEGINFMRMYTEPSCTQSRSAVMTGRHAVRTGMYTVSFPYEHGGLADDEVTIAEVLKEQDYATFFCGKAHLGDIEESHMTRQGFDEALWTPYNQILSLWNPEGEGANGVTDMITDVLVDDPYEIDSGWRPEGFVLALEGVRGESTTEFLAPAEDPDNPKSRPLRTYEAIDPECETRTLEFVNEHAAGGPFFAAYWPQLTSFMADPKKVSVSKGLSQEGLVRLDDFIGELVAELERLKIAENTLLVLMADNGPMTHDGPAGMVETLYRGGKGDYWEGGVRVPAIAWWPGTIDPGQIVGDIVHETDLFTTFARLGGAKQHIPTDRIIDGIDQTALFLNGDTHSRRDYNYIYTGQELAAIVKGRWKKIWDYDYPGLTGASFVDLYNDPREVMPYLIPGIHTLSMFNHMRERHLLWKDEYPDRPHAARAPALTGIENAREETAAVSEPRVDPEALPFDPKDHIENP